MYTKKLIILIGMVFLLSVTQAQEKKDAVWEVLNQKTDGPPALSPLPTELQLKYHYMEKQMFIHFTVNNFTGKQWGDGTESPILMHVRSAENEAVKKPSTSVPRWVLK
jgi:hypothetical protein